MRGSSFDRDEARRAWRQVARMRSGRALGGGGGSKRQGARPGRIGLGIVVAIGAVLAVTQLTDDDEPAPVPSKQAPRLAKAAAPAAAKSTSTSASTSTSTSTSTSRTPVVKPPPAITPLAAAAPKGKSVPKAAPSKRSASANTMTQPITRVAVQRSPSERTIPLGTEKTTAKVYVQVPMGRLDRMPIGAIAPSGLHVDRISLGTGYEGTRCNGAANGFRVSETDTINVCVRAVHLRKNERVYVRWEKDGVLMRRTRLFIPPRHAYRTRAGLRLRPGYEGKWRVRILTPDGNHELARATFTVGV